MMTRGMVTKEKEIKKISCIICLQPCIEDKVTVCCSGCYHSKCINLWYKINKACPICKKKIFKDDIDDTDFVITDNEE